MDASTVQRIADLATTNAATRQFKVHDLEYVQGTISLLPPPQVPVFEVTTLDGFVNMLEAGIDGFKVEGNVIHVVSHKSVQLITRSHSAYGKRTIHLGATPVEGVTGFPYFNNWGTQEEFVIGLQSGFQPSKDLEYLLRLASHIDAKSSVATVDNSVAQEITVRQGVAFAETVAVNPRLSLKPYRTFRELDEHASEVIFRIKDGGKLALFEADGGAWKIQAIGLIASWLSNRIKTSAVTALADLPIIS